MDKQEKTQQKIYHVGIYARLSVDHHNKKNESIETQIEIAKSYIKDKSEFELYQCYIDLGTSGANFERNGFENLMSDIRERKVNCVLVKDFSRFGRNYIETGNFIQKIFPFLGVRFISVTDGFDSNSTQKDEFSMNLKNLVNELYARDIAAKVKSTRISQQKNGSYTGGAAPYGYNICKIEGKRVLVVEEEAAAIVKALFYQYETKNNCKALIRWLYQNKVHRPTEYRKYKHVYCREDELLLEWSRWSVKWILTNPVYMGSLINDTGCKENTHQAIISSEQFLKIAHQFEKQSLLCKKNCENKNTQSISLNTQVIKNMQLDDIFEGILFCGDCNCKMKRNTFIKNVEKGKKRRYLYHCPNAERIDVRQCSNHTISFEKLQEIVKKSLKKEFLFSDIKKCNIMEWFDNQIQFNQNLLQKNRVELKRKIQNCKRQQSEQYLKYRNGRIDLQNFEKIQKQNRQQLQYLKKEFEETEQKEKDCNTILKECKKDFDWLLEWNTTDKWNLSGKLEKEFLHTLIEKIYVFSDKHIEIIFCFQESSVAPCGRDMEVKNGNCSLYENF